MEGQQGSGSGNDRDLSFVHSELYREVRRLVTDSYVTERAYGRTNGKNKRFMSSQPFAESTLLVFRNGIMQERGANFDYFVVDSRTIEFVSAPLTNDKVIMHYIPIDS